MKAITRFLGLLALLSMTVVNGAPPPDEKYSVVAIHAYLYYEVTGQIDSRDLLDGKVHHLWNTIIGEGEALGPSSATWVLVELTGPTFTQPGGKLAVKANVGEKNLLDQTLPLNLWFSEGNRIRVPFLAYHTGCGTLDITATLLDLPASKVDVITLKRSVPFECGE